MSRHIATHTQSVCSQKGACAIHIQRRVVHVETVGVIHTCRAQNVNVAGSDVIAHILARAQKRRNVRAIFGTRCASQVRNEHIRNSQRRGILQAQRDVALTVALRNLNRIVDIVDEHAVKGNVVDLARAAASLQVARQGRGRVWPDLDARGIRGVVHADVGDVDVRHNVVFAHVLAERTDRDAVRAVAPKRLDENVGGVWLEGDAV